MALINIVNLSAENAGFLRLLGPAKAQALQRQQPQKMALQS